MPQMTSHLPHIATFVRVVEARGFTAAARRLGISTAAVSKAVTRLENSLGVKLINRTTRSISLTDDGEMYFRRCRDILWDLQEAEAAVTHARVTPRGKLRIQLPIGLGRRVILPALTQLTLRYPELCIDVDLSDRVADLVEEGIDVAVRIGEPRDSRLVVRHLANIRFVTCASPAYLRKHGMPRTPADLAKHNCVAYVVPQTGRYHDWEFLHDNQRIVFTPQGSLNVNNAEALLDVVESVGGIARVASFVAADRVRRGTLQLVLTDCIAPGPAMYIAYAQNRHLSPRVRAFVTLMEEIIPAEPPWEKEMGLPPQAAPNQVDRQAGA